MARRRYWLAFFFAAVPSLSVAFTLKTLVMPGQVIEAHAKFEETCESCHEDAKSETQAELCLKCHTDVRTDVLAGLGYHGRDPKAKQDACYTCHDEHDGRKADIVGLRIDAFAHTNTDFPLHDSHTRVPCTDCHAAAERYRDAPRQCVDCHVGDDVHAGALARTCDSCHSAATWGITSFVHPKTFPLVGKHAATTCAGCHKDQSYAATPTECASCHRADDVHAGRNGAQCGSCHTAAAWPIERFEHATLTGFALRGKHEALSCESCHVENVTAALPSTCEGCHRGDDTHAGRLGPKCGDCHSSIAWSDTKFDHTSVASFALVGAHENLACTSCHSEGLTTKLGRECASCHGDDPHGGQLGVRCETCHTSAEWHATPRFDHGLIAFPLLGKHAALECGACHRSLAYHDAGSTCAECHGEQDAHGGAFGSACATCHTPADWHAAAFDHAAKTGFALTGAHAGLGCASCHDGGRAAPAAGAAGATACGTCHGQDDPHGGRFGLDCAACHGPDSFSDVRRR